MHAPRYLPAGDRAVTVEFGDRIDPALNTAVHALDQAITRAKPAWVTESIPTYRSLMVIYDPLRVTFAEVRRWIESVRRTITSDELPEVRVVRIPTAYGGRFGPDLPFVARHNGLSVDDVVRIHAGVEYLVHMIGFTPGFPYLGGLSNRIGAPRLAIPRIRVPAGSVAIAANQTGVYPTDSPGGWRLIGQTPVVLYSHRREDPVLLKPGDRVRFVPITESEYYRIKVEEEEDRYCVAIERRRG